MKREEGPVLGPGCRQLAATLLLLLLLLPPGPNWRKADYRALQACQRNSPYFHAYLCYHYGG